MIVTVDFTFQGS